MTDVIRMFRLNDNSTEQRVEHLQPPVERVDARLRYCVQYQDQVGDQIARAEALAEREEELWRRQQGMLGDPALR